MHINIGRRIEFIPGWDCHGLPIEIKTIEKLGLNKKRDNVVSLRKEATKFASEAIANQKHLICELF